MDIKGKFVILRAPREEDQKMICDMFNDRELENYVVGWAWPISYEQQLDYFHKHLSDNKDFRFVIETEADGALGIATLTDIDWKNRRACHGIKLANIERRSKGIGTDTVMAIMRYAFDELCLHRLDGCWFDENIASKRLYTKCGWKPEGVRRECVYKRGSWRDLTISSILEQDYRNLIKTNKYWGQQDANQ